MPPFMLPIMPPPIMPPLRMWVCWAMTGTERAARPRAATVASVSVVVRFMGLSPVMRCDDPNLGRLCRTGLSAGAVFCIELSQTGPLTRLATVFRRQGLRKIG